MQKSCHTLINLLCPLSPRSVRLGGSLRAMELVAPPAPAGLVLRHDAAGEVHAGGQYWSELSDVASASLGTAVLFATDDWFAAAEGMLQDEPPAFDAAAFTEWGKWMDGWETRRKRIAGHDWCILRLGLPATLRGLEVDTGFFTGNQAPAISVQACCADEGLQSLGALAATRDGAGAEGGGGFAADERALAAAAAVGSERWTEILPRTALDPGYESTRHHFFSLAEHLASPSGDRTAGWTHVRVNIFPDGGVSRFRVRGEVLPPQGTAADEERDMAAVENGGVAIAVCPPPPSPHPTPPTNPPAHPRRETGEVGRRCRRATSTTGGRPTSSPPGAPPR